MAADQAGSSSSTAGSSPAAANGGGGGAAAGEEQKGQGRENARDDKDVAMQDQQPEEKVEMDYDVAGDDQWDIG